METSTRILRTLKYLLIAGMFAAGAYFYGRLPDLIPSHWGFSGQVDSYMAKPWGVFLMPLVALAMAVLFPFFKHIDPKAENYKIFAKTWELLQFCFVAFFAYIFAMQLDLSLQPLPSPDFVGRFVTFGIGVLFVIIGNFMGKIRQNFFVGMRTPWSLSDPEVWNRSQRFGGWAFVIGGLVILVESLLWIWPEVVFFAIVLLVTVLPIGYSYVLYHKRHGNEPTFSWRPFLTLIAICMLVGAGVAALVRISSSEDEWICVNGQWTAHGHPSVAIPTGTCR